MASNDANDRSFEEWWNIFKEEIEQNEKTALEQLCMPDHLSIIKASKVNPASPEFHARREEIRNETSMKRVMELGRKVPLNPDFHDVGHKLNIMFSITYQKFIQNPQLAVSLLYDTQTKPIWHYCDDIFWGTSRPASGEGAAPSLRPSADESDERNTGKRSAAARQWWSGDNWNGKILSVVRALIQRENTLDPQRLKEKVARYCREHCPCPEEFFEPPAGRLHPHTTKMAKGTVIANRFRVEENLDSEKLGSFVGNFCYICEDISPCDPPEEEVVREYLAAGSLKDPRDRATAAIAALCAGGGDAEIQALRKACDTVGSGHFFGGPRRRWWLAVEARLRKAEELAAAAPPARLEAAFQLRQLLPDPPLYRPRIRARVFIKTFQKYDRRIVAEIRRCSSKAPDFSRSLQPEAPGWPDHPNLSVIYGGSHWASLSGSTNQRLAFVGLEHCRGLDLYLFAQKLHGTLGGNTDPDHALLRGLFRQVADAVSYLHRCDIVHGDLKPDNIVVTPRGLVKLIDYGAMTLLSEIRAAEQSVLFPSYASPELHATMAQRRGLEQILRSNDVWMMAHVLLVLGFRSSMPRNPGRPGELLYPCQSVATSSSGGFRQFLAAAGKLRQRLELADNRGLRNLLFFMYAAPQDRLTAHEVLQDQDWVNPAPAPAALEPMLQGLVPAGEEDQVFAPDVDVIDYLRPGGPAGFLVCRVGSTPEGLGTGLEKGDVVVLADGRPLLLPDDPVTAAGELSAAELAASPAWRALGDRAATALFNRLDAERQGLVVAEVFRRRAAEELAKGMFGTYKSLVKLQAWRPAAGNAGGTTVDLEVQRTKDCQPLAGTQTTPERFRQFLLRKVDPTDTQESTPGAAQGPLSNQAATASLRRSLWSQILAEKLDGLALLGRLQTELSKWQALEEVGAQWGFAEVLATWRQRGLVEHDPGMDHYHFDAAKWPVAP